MSSLTKLASLVASSAFACIFPVAGYSQGRPSIHETTSYISNALLQDNCCASFISIKNDIKNGVTYPFLEISMRSGRDISVSTSFINGEKLLDYKIDGRSVKLNIVCNNLVTCITQIEVGGLKSTEVTLKFHPDAYMDRQEKAIRYLFSSLGIKEVADPFK